MPTRHCLLALPLILLAACGDKSVEPAQAQAPAPKGSAPPDPPACDAAVGDAMRKEIEPMCRVAAARAHAGLMAAPWPVEPVEVGAKTIEIAIAPGQLTTSDGTFSLDEVERYVSMVIMPIVVASVGGPPSAGWSLSIDGATSVGDVARVLKVLSDREVPDGVLVFATNPVGPMPAPRKPERLAALAGKPADALWAAFDAAIPDCGSLKEVAGARSMIAEDQVCIMLAEHLSRANVECGCKLDLDETMTLLHALHVGISAPERVLAHVPVRIDATAPPLAHEPTVAWRTVVADLPRDALRGLWLKAP